jgi:hypothetical protein
MRYRADKAETMPPIMPAAMRTLFERFLFVVIISVTVRAAINMTADTPSGIVFTPLDIYIDIFSNKVTIFIVEFK